MKIGFILVVAKRIATNKENLCQNFGERKIFIKNKFSVKKFWVKENSKPKKFWSIKKKLVKLIFQKKIVKKCFWAKKIVG